MAETCTNKLQESSNADATSYTTAGTLTPSANKLYLCTVLNSKATTPDALASLTGGGLTWTLVAEGTGANGMRAHTYRALSASPGAAAAIVADFGANTQTGCAFIVDEFDGMDATGSNGANAIVQSVVNGGTATTTATVTLASFGDAVNNAGYAVGIIDGNPAATAEAGWTIKGNASSASGPSRRAVSIFRTGEDTSPSFTWTGNQAFRMIGIEVKVAGAATTYTPKVLAYG